MHHHASESLRRLRAEGPVVHHITNWVTIAACADLAKAFGASPVMAHATEEAADMAGIANAVVLNIGTLTTGLVEAMRLAGRAANARGIPVVLDVCGAGATPFRNRACQSLLADMRVDIIKGNASEIACVAGLAVNTRGVDSGAVRGDHVRICLDLAQARQAVVVMTGAVDTVAAPDGRVFRVSNGCAMMARVVGTGCLAATAIGCFAALGGDLAEAAVSALVAYEVAGELAAASGAGPGSFRTALIDTVAALDPVAMGTRIRVSATDSSPKEICQ